MAKSKFEYVKDFEKDDRCLLETWIVCRVDGKNFHTFTSKHEFEKPNDVNALHLMNEVAISVILDNSDILMAYGQSDEYSFIFRRSSSIYERRESKLLSTIVGKFSSSYIFYWKKHFPNKELLYTPTFEGKIFQYSLTKHLRDYLSSCQKNCHINNLYNTCYWKMVLEQNKTCKEAEIELKDTKIDQKNEILFSSFNTNYNNEPEIFRKGTILVKKQYLKKSNQVQVPQMLQTKHSSIVLFHGDIIGDKFWTSNPKLLPGTHYEMTKSKSEHVKDFEKDDRCLLETWIVCRIDGKNFHTFTAKHNFEKPNDVNALNLMNEAAMTVISDNNDIFMAYGQSDEYSFVFRRSATSFERRESKLLSMIVGKFSSSYIFYWKKHFPNKELLYPPSFDARIILYPRKKIIRDYLSWRQADCHINNLYNTCYWKMVLEQNKTGKEVENELKETNSEQKKNEILSSSFNTDYNDEPEIFRKGTVIVKKQYLCCDQLSDIFQTKHSDLVLFHGDIIGDMFWTNNPHLLSD